MSFASLEPQNLLDLRTNVKQNAHFISSQQVLYTAGAVLLLHDFQTQRQRYLQLLEKSTSLEMIILSPTRNLAAIIINDEKGHIVIYEVSSLKKRRTLYLPNEAQTKRFEHICFSFDEKLVIAVTGEPDWMMLSYNWERGKVETSTRANYLNNPGPVSQVYCSPTDSAVCCLVGPSLFRLMNMQETVWRQYGFQKADQVVITTAAFLGGDRILAGTACGKLLLVDYGELKAVYDAATVQTIKILEKEEGGTAQPVAIPKPSANKHKEDKQVRAMVAFSKGFAYSCKVGQVHMFEKEDKDVYTKRNLFVIADTDHREVQTPPLNTVNHLSIDPAQDKLLATTNRSQLYTVRLWGPNISKQPEIAFKHLGESIHHGPILDLALCAWKPIFMTCGAIDRTVRLWNYETATAEMIKQYEEDVLSVSLHPTGLFAAIGFTDQLRYMMVLLDDILPHRVFPVALCHLSCFSWLGHFLAVVNKLTILVYSTVTFREIRKFKGHGGKITSLVWTPDDQKLISCGAEGAIYEWDMVQGLRVNETVEKGVSFWECAVTADGKFVYAAGSDGLLKEISESSILRSFQLGQPDLPHIILSRSEQMMFVCGDDGSLLSLKLPLMEPLQKKSFLFHHSKISKIAMTYDDQTVITVSETGTLCIWNVTEAEGKTVLADPAFTFCTGVLIPKLDLQDKVGKIKELNQRLQELVLEQEYRIKQAEANHNTTLQELHESFNEEIGELKMKVLKTEKSNERKIANLLTEIAAIKELNEMSRQEMEAVYDTRLLTEYDKLTTALAEQKVMADVYEERIANIIQTKDQAMEEVRSDFMLKIKKLEGQIEQVKKELTQDKSEHEELKRQIEEDADREIVELKAAYEKTLREERELNVQFRAEAGVMRKKVDLSLKENEKFMRNISQLLTEQQRYEKQIANLNEEITELKKEIYERDLTIQDKEKRIYDMKKKNEELEKFKFVLTHKIEEIKNQLEPKEREIEEKDQQIAEMEAEMELMQLANTNLDVTITETKEKASATEMELKKSKDRCEVLSNTLKRMGLDILNVVDNIQDIKKLKIGVKGLYEKFASSSEISNASVAQTELEAELMRQREHLESTVKKLNTAMKRIKDTPSEGTKTMKENILLIEEINELRKEVKVRDDKIAKYERLVLTSSGTMISGKELNKKLEAVLKTNDHVQHEMVQEIEKAHNIAKLQEKEMDRLRKQLK